MKKIKQILPFGILFFVLSACGDGSSSGNRGTVALENKGGSIAGNQGTPASGNKGESIAENEDTRRTPCETINAPTTGEKEVLMLSEREKISFGEVLSKIDGQKLLINICQEIAHEFNEQCSDKKKECEEKVRAQFEKDMFSKNQEIIFTRLKDYKIEDMAQFLHDSDNLIPEHLSPCGTSMADREKKRNLLESKYGKDKVNKAFSILNILLSESIEKLSKVMGLSHEPVTDNPGDLQNGPGGFGGGLQNGAGGFGGGLQNGPGGFPGDLQNGPGGFGGGLQNGPGGFPGGFQGGAGGFPGGFQGGAGGFPGDLQNGAGGFGGGFQGGAGGFPGDLQNGAGGFGGGFPNGAGGFGGGFPNGGGGFGGGFPNGAGGFGGGFPNGPGFQKFNS